ncbi:hypothetical protein GCM10010468_60580 [Actinocorallia longicatena]|uniref:SseB protein N-terminal domain-containing protein n=1 Tax=Actinocorallia longicatena TaxID=111803 RepID=A0ABP6QH22_9ACTN
MEWSEFAQRFALELAGLDRDTILIVRERDESRHYVQAMREPDRLYAESVSNNFLDGHLTLTPADEEVLVEAGWRPPTADWPPANWWTELPPESGHGAFALLADMMVTALRDVQGVRRPLDLVYESFHRHGTGLIELAGLGIDVSDPSRVTARRAAPVPAPVAAAPLEQQLLAARERGDHLGYFDLLLDAELLLPASGPAVEDPGLTEHTTVVRDGVTLLPAFTSPQALMSAGYAGLHRRTTLAVLAAAWPDPAWRLTVNLGGPSEISLDAAMLSRLDAIQRSSPHSTVSDGLPITDLLTTGPIPPDLLVPGALPHRDLTRDLHREFPRELPPPRVNGREPENDPLSPAYRFPEEDRPPTGSVLPASVLPASVLPAPPLPLPDVQAANGASRPHEGDVRLAAPGRPIRLPHGAELFSGDELTAVYDASSGQWAASRVPADGA